MTTRDHIARFPGGVYRGQAADLLAGRKTAINESWIPVTKPLSLFEPQQGAAAKDQLTAQAQALDRAQADAERQCRDFGAGTLYRYRSAKAIAESWTCGQTHGGTTCGFEGHAECALDERHETETETCG
jgi:hypothetical protein